MRKYENYIPIAETILTGIIIIFLIIVGIKSTLEQKPVVTAIVESEEAVTENKKEEVFKEPPIDIYKFNKEIVTKPEVAETIKKPGPTNDIPKINKEIVTKPEVVEAIKGSDPIDISEDYECYEEPEEIIEDESDNYENGMFCYISDYERNMIICMVAGEAGSCSDELMHAVAQTMYVAMQNSGCRPGDLIWRYDGYSDYGNYNFTDEQMSRVSYAVSRVFDYGDMCCSQPIEFFYNPNYCSSDWHETLTYVTTIDDCRFFCR